MLKIRYRRKGKLLRLLQKNRKQLFAKSYCFEKKEKYNRVRLEPVTQSFENRKARLAPYRDKIFSGRITEELRLFLALLQDKCKRENVSTPRIAVA